MAHNCLKCGRFTSESPDGDYLYCDNCKEGWDIADYCQERSEKETYVWFDEEDRPFLTDTVTNLKLSDAVL